MSLLEGIIDSRDNPLAVVEDIAANNDWSFERSGEDEITILTQGTWTDYQLSFTWMGEIEALHLACAFDMKIPPQRRAETQRLIALINEQLWIGHFDIWAQTGTIMFRADFPNPEGLLRHGETGNIQMKKLVKGALLIPQKCTYEILDHHYVFVVDKDDIVSQQRIQIEEELEDLFIVSDGLNENDKIVLEGLRHARNGEKAQYEFEEPAEAIKHLKLRAE